MRRLAKTFRKDDYSSYKDYQDLYEKSAITYHFNSTGTNKLYFNDTITCHNNDIFSIGGYVLPSEITTLTISVFEDNTLLLTNTHKLNTQWNRVGFCFSPNKELTNIKISLSFSSSTLSVWGFTTGIIDLENYEVLEDLSNDEICASLNLPHLVPEAFYLEHDNASHLILDRALSTKNFIAEDEKLITVKKCCYCQRNLPIGTTISSSAFHKHKSKKTGYQNECRSCKKWRINNFFNPDRSSDKLNESSIITRERKILLKEPEQIISLKDRNTGEGLKSQVWKRFGKKCFNCPTPLRLKDVQLDHTRPLAYLWPIDQYATCLCATCNNNKHDSFPVDFYNDNQLHELSAITHLPYSELIKKDVCDEQLNRILSDITYFATNLDARTFRSIATKVKEVRPSIDLFELLKRTDIKIYNDIVTKLKERKES